jgi:hypothetical protein
MSASQAVVFFIAVLEEGNAVQKSHARQGLIAIAMELDLLLAKAKGKNHV